MKWEKAGPRFLDCYKALFDLFMDSEGIVFNSIAIEKSRSHILEARSDPELGFYKFYYHLLWRRLDPQFSYNIRVDRRRGIHTRLGTLCECCNRKLASEFGPAAARTIRTIQPICSRSSPVTQVADMILGAISASYEGAVTKPAKLELMEHMKQRLRLGSLAQGSPLRLGGKFNNWQIRLE